MPSIKLCIIIHFSFTIIIRHYFFFLFVYNFVMCIFVHKAFTKLRIIFLEWIPGHRLKGMNVSLFFTIFCSSGWTVNSWEKSSLHITHMYALNFNQSPEAKATLLFSGAMSSFDTNSSSPLGPHLLYFSSFFFPFLLFSFLYEPLGCPNYSHLSHSQMTVLPPSLKWQLSAWALQYSLFILCYSHFLSHNITLFLRMITYW